MQANVVYAQYRNGNFPKRITLEITHSKFN